jgi:16S rRNA (cytidine1402-2'-O)-methyltransferase
MLTLVATPIGSFDEISLRSIELLKNADLIICESTKETSKLLKALQIKAKRYELLNEHSTEEDVLKLTHECRDQNVVLVTDCGTPSFCDPGFQLVEKCRKNKILVKTSLGASSLMGLLSLSSEKIDQFLFRGFLPAENESREKEWQKIKKNNEAFVLMDTPYRLKKTLDECVLHLSDRKMLMVLNLSTPEEQVYEGSPAFVKKNIEYDKAEFMLLIYRK